MGCSELRAWILFLGYVSLILRFLEAILARSFFSWHESYVTIIIGYYWCGCDLGGKIRVVGLDWIRNLCLGVAIAGALKLEGVESFFQAFVRFNLKQFKELL